MLYDTDYIQMAHYHYESINVISADYMSYIVFSKFSISEAYQLCAIISDISKQIKNEKFWGINHIKIAGNCCAAIHGFLEIVYI